MDRERTLQDSGGRVVGDGPRAQLLAGSPFTQRYIDVAGVRTAVLEAGAGSPVVLLHGQGAWAGVWLSVAPGLVEDHRVIAPDLPGLGASDPLQSAPSRRQLSDWLTALIGQTCPSPPSLVGISLGGSIAARFAAEHGDRLASLVLLDTGGLAGRVRPPLAVLAALVRANLRPSRAHTARLLSRLLADPEAVRRRLGHRWDSLVASLTDLARTPHVRRANQQLLRALGLPAIPEEDLAGIAVPTTLIWGREDRVVPLSGARSASARLGWPMHVIDDAGHLCILDRPDAVVHALTAALRGDDR